MICVYEPDCRDFSNNGLGTVLPQSATVTETLNGEWELKLEHPLDEAGKWRKLIEGYILRAPVPASMTPRVRQMTVESGPDTLIYRVSTRRDNLRLRSGTGTNYRILSSYPKGTEVVVLNKTTSSWYEVSCPDGKRGYMSTSYLTYVRTISNTRIVAGEVIEPRQLRDQPFRIYRTVPDLEKITVYARHIFYDLMDNMIRSVSPGANDTGMTVLQQIASGCMSEHPFTFFSDIETTASDVSFENANPVDAIMGSGGFIENYGGELARDWFDVYIADRVGTDTDIELRQGKNLTGISYDVDLTKVTTRIMPTGQDANGGTLYLPELYVDSPNFDKYPWPKWSHLSVSEARESNSGSERKSRDQCYREMRDAANAEFEKGCDLPTVTLKVDFINCLDTEEYRQYGFLQNIFLGDTVRVIARRIGVSVSMRMTQYTYDCLTRMYTDMTLGSVEDTPEGNTITGRQLPTGIITGSKLAINSVDTRHIMGDAVGSMQIKQAAIETGHIQNAAITSALIGEAAIQSAHIADAAVTEAKIDDASITAAKIAEAVIQSAHIADAAVTRAKIALLAVGEGQIDDLAVGAAKIQDAAVTTAKIEDLAVTGAKIANAAITSAHIENATIDTAKIALGAITTALIEAGAVGTAQIADGSITDAKIVELSANRITTGTLSVERLIVVGAEKSIVYTINEANGTAQLSQTTIDGGSLTQRSISADRIVAGAITSNEIAAATILANNIAAGAITTDKLAAESVDASKIKAGSITTDHLSSTFGQALDLSSNKGINLRVSEINDSIDRVRQAAVAQVQVLYAQGSSNLVPPVEGWQTDAPDWQDGQYMWQKTVTTYVNGDTDTSDATCLTGATGEAATTLRIDSSRGTVFKNNDVSTVLSAVIYHGSERITDITALRRVFGSGASIQWSWQRMDENRFGVISAEDSRISEDGFMLTLTSADVDTKVTFMCELVV